MAVRLPDHGHCEYCGDPLTLGEMFCSEECELSMRKEESDEKRKNVRFYVLVGVSLIGIAAVAVILRFL